MVSFHTSTQTPQITLGEVVGVHGIQGWIKIVSYCDPREQIGQYQVWHLQPGDQTYTLEQIRTPAHKAILAKLSDVDDRDAAHNLYKKEITVPMESLAELPPNQYYWFQLQGLQVFNEQDQCLGQVQELLATGANDVLVVKQASDGQRLLIPYLEELVVKAVDLNAKKLIVDWEIETTEERQPDAR